MDSHIAKRRKDSLSSYSDKKNIDDLVEGGGSSANSADTSNVRSHVILSEQQGNLLVTSSIPANITLDSIHEANSTSEIDISNSRNDSIRKIESPKQTSEESEGSAVKSFFKKPAGGGVEDVAG